MIKECYLCTANELDDDLARFIDVREIPVWWISHDLPVGALLCEDCATDVVKEDD